MLTALSGDFRLALRRMARRPGFTALVVATLALGIGANAAIFSMISGLLLRPLPYPEADRLVQVWNKYPLMDLPQASVSVPDYYDRRGGVKAFEETALSYYSDFNLTSDGPPERVIGMRATASLFALLGTRPAHGRVFGESEEEPGNERVVVLSDRLWQRRFGGDPAVVGRDLRINGELHQVIGVMPAGFVFPYRDVELYKPVAFTPEERSDDARGNEFASMLARLAPGATLAGAQAEIDAIHEANKERFPEAREFWESSGFGAMVVDYREELFGALRPTLWLLQAMVALVLLIACANVASLLLTRLSSRQRELALRASLGAGPWRMARQLLVEGLLLAFLGSALGLWLGTLGIRLLGRLTSDPAARGVEVGLDGNVLAFALAAAVVTGLVTSLLPALSLWRLDANEVLKEGSGRGSSLGRGAGLPRRLLVVAEVAMAVVLLVGAGLMVRTLVALEREDPGFEAENVLLAQVSLPMAKYSEPGTAGRFHEGVLERLRALPGVRSAGLVSSAPFSGSSSSGSYDVEGYEPAPGESAPHALQRTVDEGFFRTLGIELVAGRTFEPSDDANTEPVVVVDRRLVEKYFPQESPLGQRLRRGGDEGTSYTIVGVVEPIKIRDLEQPVTKETMYYPFRQQQAANVTYAVRAAVDPLPLAQQVREAVHAVDPEQPIYGVAALDEQLRRSLGERRTSVTLLLLFGALAVVLAAVGLYGVLAYSMAQRTREIGTRAALGAAPLEILRLILGQGLGLALTGVAAGTVAALLLGRLVEAMLYGVSARDPATYALVAAALVAVALLASYQPARRAARLDPVEALRDE